MTTTSDQMRAATSLSSGLRDALQGLQQALGVVLREVTGESARGLSEAALLEVQHALTDRRRDADRALALTCAEVSRRSAPDLGAGGLARKNGFSDPTRLIAGATGGSRRDADRLIRAGRTMADAQEQERRKRAAERAGTVAPEPETPVYAVVARALEDGRVSVEAASAITRMLDGAGPSVPRERVQVVEGKLVDKAVGLTLEQFMPIVKRFEASLHRDDGEQRQRRLAGERFFMMTETRDGAVEIRGKLDPASAAPLRAVIDGMVRDAFRRRREQDALAEDKRSRGQIAADSLVTLARHMMGCDQAPIAHATTKVVVRIDLEALRTGVGAAEVDGSGVSVPAGRLRRIAVDAGYLPAVLGGDSVPLDLGRTKRQFTPAQRDALLERDGGCAMCGAPPSHCEAHHIEWWDRDGGRSDLSNGVMLCVACHHTVHRDRWEIDASADDVWFRPPASVDPRRRPRAGGKARFGITRREREQVDAAGTQPGADHQQLGPPGDQPGVPSEDPTASGETAVPARSASPRGRASGREPAGSTQSAPPLGHASRREPAGSARQAEPALF